MIYAKNIMKASSFLFFLLTSFCVSNNIQAQPKGVLAVAKSIFTLTTFKADGSILESSHGVFIDKNGTAITPWKPFVGAARATLIDARGKQYEVDYLLGADELYNVAKIHINGTTNAAVIAKDAATPTTEAWLIPYSISKPTCKSIKITETEKFSNQYSFYNLEAETSDTEAGCPIVNTRGEVLGLLEISPTTYKRHATDASYACHLTLNSLSISDPLFSQTSIRTALPEKENEAQVTLLFAKERCDDTTLGKYADDFIKRFPHALDGYVTKAEIAIDNRKFDSAAKEMELAINNVEQKDEAHYHYARLIYQKETLMSDTLYSPWNLDKALHEATVAYDIHPQPLFRHLQAKILYAKGEYQEAYRVFEELTKTSLRGGEVFFEMSQCKQQQGAAPADILMLLDSAVNACQRPFNQTAAIYILARGQQLDNMGEYRKALRDYNTYDTLMYRRAHHSFYYTRFKCESHARLFQQALDDIAYAIILNPTEPTYYAEMASLELRVRKFPEAIRTAKRCTEIAPEYADGYLLLGIAQGENKEKKEAIKNLNRAKELGDSRAEEYLKKYK